MALFQKQKNNNKLQNFLFLSYLIPPKNHVCHYVFSWIEKRLVFLHVASLETCNITP